MATRTKQSWLVRLAAPAALVAFALLGTAASASPALAARHIEVSGTVTSVGLGTLELQKDNGNEFKVRLPEGDDQLIQVGDRLSLAGDTDRGGAIVVDDGDWTLVAPALPAVGVLGASTTNPAPAPITLPAPSAQVNHGDELDCNVVGGQDSPFCNGKVAR